MGSNNAYELADELQELDSRLHLIDLFKSANMLRQQADRIAELEKQLYFKDYYEELPETPVGLQTTPQTKPLSDADIQQISHRYHYTYNPDYVGFARAIEERHGIK